MIEKSPEVYSYCPSLSLWDIRKPTEAKAVIPKRSALLEEPLV